jgi:hypothetical protein
MTNNKHLTKSVETNRRPASPFHAVRPFESASCAPPFLSAAVAHLYRSAEFVRFSASSAFFAAPFFVCRKERRARREFCVWAAARSSATLSIAPSFAGDFWLMDRLSPNQALHANSRPPSTLDAQAGFGHLHCAHRWLTAAVGELFRSAFVSTHHE